MRLTILLVSTFLCACATSSSRSDISPDKPGPDDKSSTPQQPNPTDPAKIGTSGSRLKARSYAGSDGSKQFIGWFDSELGRNCSFGTATDGKLRCLPESISINPVFFADSGCTQRVSQTAKNCSPAPTASLGQGASSTTCATYTLTIFEVGAKHSGTLYQGSPASCTALQPTSASYTTDIYDFYRIGAEVSPSTYVEATDTHD